MSQKSPAIVRAETVEELARHTVRWTSLGVLTVSFIGTIMAFNGSWPTSWRFWEQVSLVAAIAGIALQAFCTLMEWANRKKRFSIQYIGPLLIDIAGTYVGFAALLVPVFVRALQRATLPELVATIVAHLGVVVLAFWFAFYPEQNLVKEQPMEPNQYAETAVTIVGLALLALGTLAMGVRWVLGRRRTLADTGRQFVADVRKGEGFTFHRNGETQAPAQRLAPRQWLDLVNHRPDQVPHLFIEGGSGAGKTTIATAILHDRPGPVAIVGVKPDDGWGEGYIYRSNDRAAYLAQILADVRRRLDDNDASGLTIVLDDFTRLASSHKEAVELYKEVADVGRSLRIRLILIARGRLVKALGASGESDLLEHFVFITVSRNEHTAALEIEEEIRALDTGPVLSLAKPLPAARWWKPAEVSAVPRDDRGVLVRLLEADSAGDIARTGMPGIGGIPQSDAVPANENEPEDTGSVPAMLTPEAIRILYAALGSKNKVAALLTGSKPKRLAAIDAALAAETVDDAA